MVAESGLRGMHDLARSIRATAYESMMLLDEHGVQPQTSADIVVTGELLELSLVALDQADQLDTPTAEEIERARFTVGLLEGYMPELVVGDGDR